MSNPIDPEQRQIRKNPRVVYRDLAADQGGVLLHLETGQYHGLNALGATIWNLLDDHATPAELAAKLQPRLPGQLSGLERDIEHFIASLHARDLIVNLRQPVSME